MPSTTAARASLAVTQHGVVEARKHLRALLKRLAELDAASDDRGAMTPSERVEFDLIGGLLCDVRKAVDGNPQAL